MIKYEDLVASRGSELGKFFPAAAELEENLSSKNLNKYYDRALMAGLGERLLKRDGPIWNFYSKRDVESLLSEVGSNVWAELRRLRLGSCSFWRCDGAFCAVRGILHN